MQIHVLSSPTAEGNRGLEVFVAAVSGCDGLIGLAGKRPQYRVDIALVAG